MSEVPAPDGQPAQGSPGAIAVRLVTLSQQLMDQLEVYARDVQTLHEQRSTLAEAVRRTERALVRAERETDHLRDQVEEAAHRPVRDPFAADAVPTVPDRIAGPSAPAGGGALRWLGRALAASGPLMGLGFWAAATGQIATPFTSTPVPSPSPTATAVATQVVAQRGDAPRPTIVVETIWRTSENAAAPAPGAASAPAARPANGAAVTPSVTPPAATPTPPAARSASAAAPRLSEPTPVIKIVERVVTVVVTPSGGDGARRTGRSSAASRRPPAERTPIAARTTSLPAPTETAAPPPDAAQIGKPGAGATGAPPPPPAPSGPTRCAVDLVVPALDPGAAYAVRVRQQRDDDVVLFWPEAAYADGSRAVLGQTRPTAPTKDAAARPIASEVLRGPSGWRQLPPLIGAVDAVEPELSLRMPAGPIAAVFVNEAEEPLPASRAILIYASGASCP